MVQHTFHSCAKYGTEVCQSVAAGISPFFLLLTPCPPPWRPLFLTRSESCLSPPLASFSVPSDLGTCTYTFLTHGFDLCTSDCRCASRRCALCS